MRKYRSYSIARVNTLKLLLRKLITLVPLTTDVIVKVQLRIAIVAILKLLEVNNRYSRREKYSLEDELLCLVYKQYGMPHKHIMRQIPSLKKFDVETILRKYGFYLQRRVRGKYKKRPKQGDLFGDII